jgi:prepilin-type N-terminal cleavage/methylation domain-containing protein
MQLRRNLRLKKKNGFSLIELIFVMAVGAALVFLAVPSFFETFSSRLKTSAQNLSQDMRFAQNEAVRQGDASPGGGSFRTRKVFVVFDVPNNRYSIWRWEDSNGNNMREAGEFNPDLGGAFGSDKPLRTASLDAGVYFRIHADVSRSACGATGPVPGKAVTFQDDPHLPCSGNPCIRFNGKGFVEGLNGAAYLTDENHSFAVSANRAGLFTFCKWNENANNWVTAH